MSSRRFPAPDLFGERAPRDDGARRSDLVDLALAIHGETDKAWLLSDEDDKAKAQWLPKSQAERGEGKDAGIWTMPGWLAKDRGWV